MQVHVITVFWISFLSQQGNHHLYGHLSFCDHIILITLLPDDWHVIHCTYLSIKFDRFWLMCISRKPLVHSRKWTCHQPRSFLIPLCHLSLINICVLPLEKLNCFLTLHSFSFSIIVYVLFLFLLASFSQHNYFQILLCCCT